jgi:tetratricopeptide (TPR) repeat protein
MARTGSAALKNPEPAKELAVGEGAVVELTANPVGDSASQAAMARLALAMKEMKRQGVQPALDQAVAALKRRDWAGGRDWCLRVLAVDDSNGIAWWMLGISRDKLNDVGGALEAFEKALILLPNQGEIANDLGRMAFRIGEHRLAAKFFAHFLLRFPGNLDGTINLACAQRALGQYDDAVETLRAVIYANPETAALWGTLGTVLAEKGETDQSMVFFDEALRLNPEEPGARYNRANARLQIGDVAGALEDYDFSIPRARELSDAAMMRFARGTALLALGELEQGWEAYETRFDENYATHTRFMVAWPRWKPEDELSGKTLFVLGEQGLGDEILFANCFDDVLEALGPDGRLILGVEPRLVPMFARSFPRALVVPHSTWKLKARFYRGAILPEDLGHIDLWTPFGSLLRRFRRSVDAFPNRPAYMKADPDRVSFWKAQLEALGGAPKVGVLWKSNKKDANRSRFFSPFEEWEVVLRTPGVTFVNLQYGDCSTELEYAESAGLDIWDPPGIDLKNDLDDVAALCCAMDLIVAPANATMNIGASCGVATWLIVTPGSWPMLGTSRYPWYPAVEQVFVSPSLQAWDQVMAQVAAKLSERFTSAT